MDGGGWNEADDLRREVASLRAQLAEAQAKHDGLLYQYKACHDEKATIEQIAQGLADAARKLRKLEDDHEMRHGRSEASLARVTRAAHELDDEVAKFDAYEH